MSGKQVVKHKAAPEPEEDGKGKGTAGVQEPRVKAEKRAEGSERSRQPVAGQGGAQARYDLMQARLEQLDLEGQPAAEAAARAEAKHR